MNGDRHHNGRISMWLIRQSTKRRTRMGMHDPDSAEYRPYKPNSATPIPAPVIQNADLMSAIDAGDMEPAKLDEPEGDAGWAVEATEHVEEERERIDEEDDEADLPGFETAYPYKDNADDDHSDDPDPMQPYGDTVADLPDENGATVDDHCDDGFIPREDESSEESHARFHVERDGEHDGHTHG